MEIKTKTEFIELNRQGRFGNRLRVWDTLTDLHRDNYNGPVGIRGRHASMRTFKSHIPAAAVDGALRRLIHDHSQYTEADFFFGEGAPDDKLLIQGEYGHIGHLSRITGHYLRYSTQPGLNMRQAMQIGFQEVEGVAALAILQQHMDSLSWIDFTDIRQLYPDSIIEFGVYGCCLGELPFRNTIIWEVRNY